MAIREQATTGKKTAAKKPAPAQKAGVKAKAAPVKAGVKRVPPGRSGKTGTAKKKKVITYKAPADVKSCFLEVQFTLGKDGLLSPSELLVEAIKGSLTNEKAPRYDLLDLDPATATAVLTRMHYKLFAANPLKRLPAGASYTVIVRLTVNKEGLMRAGIKSIYWIDEKGRERELTADLKDKNDPKCQARRRIRACGRFLAGAFTGMLPMDELKELKRERDAVEAAGEDDEED